MPPGPGHRGYPAPNNGSITVSLHCQAAPRPHNRHRNFKKIVPRPLFKQLQCTFHGIKTIIELVDGIGWVGQ